MTEKDYWIAFSTFVGIGPQRFKLLVEYFGNAQKAWETPIAKYREIGFSEKLSSSFEKHRKSFSLGDYLRKMKSLKVETITLNDKEYPERLKSLEDAPFLLYKRGNGSLSQISEISIAVIGTRKMTAYGRDVTETFVSELSLNGITIISGLALGIDGMAHKVTLDNKGRTIAVLGNGLDTIYPPAHTSLARQIIESDNLLISEFPLGYPAMPFNFPVRNRIVSGLSLGVLVIEGTEKSGTLLTCSNAATQGRDVFAIPGPVTSITSKAPNMLIKNGAKLVEKAQDILDELNIKEKSDKRQARSILPGSPDEEKIILALTQEELDFDNLVTIVGLPTHEILSLLTLMELKGMVKNVGGIYRKV